jgi:hypothetical protein
MIYGIKFDDGETEKNVGVAQIKKLSNLVRGD